MLLQASLLHSVPVPDPTLDLLGGLLHNIFSQPARPARPAPQRTKVRVRWHGAPQNKPWRPVVPQPVDTVKEVIEPLPKEVIKMVEKEVPVVIDDEVEIEIEIDQTEIEDEAERVKDE